MEPRFPQDPERGRPLPRQEREGGTTPKDATKDATTPPGNGVLEEDAVRNAHEKLHQASGGH